MMLIDSHCHIHFDDLYGQLADVLVHMRDAHVCCALCVSVLLSDAQRITDLLETQSCLYGSIGVHPNHTENCVCEVDDLLRLAVLHDKMVAIGETGLDYMRQSNEAALVAQRRSFAAHIAAARQLHKPLIIHMRFATDDTLAMLQSECAAECGGIFHCFTEDRKTARAVLDLGFYLSFSGIITFKNAHTVRDVAAYLPSDRILIETDSPYLAPVPHRGQLNQPAWVSEVAQALATVRGCSIDVIAEQTTQNFLRVFPSVCLQ